MTQPSGSSAPGAAPPGIEAERVGAFFARHVEGGNAPLAFEILSGGRSNLTYLVSTRTAPVRHFVLRRPPLGHVLPTAHDMVREHRVLSALAGTNVPVARPLALCEDPDVTGAPFYVMEYRPGVVIERELPRGFAETRDERRRLSCALVDTLVRLHAVDVARVGLSDFGRPAGYLERQVRRWSQQWERSKTRELPAIDELARRLAASLPASPAPTLVHGDYRLGNVALDPEDPGRIVAIFDWEMATLGDPLSDLGYTLIYWGEPGDPAPLRAPGTHLAVTAQPGFLSRAELVERYARGSGRDVTAIDFYQVLALFKLAVISEGIHARFLMGKTVGEGFEGLGAQVAQLTERALDIALRAQDPRLGGDGISG
jgi:aminoglycoside phosphotransferase (APT) family kinase protein